MSVMDNLDLKAYKKILRKYEKNPDTDVYHMMASEMERPKGCCFVFMYCCCYCLLHNTMSDYISRRANAIQDLLFKKYPSKVLGELMIDLRSAIEVIEAHKMKLYDVRNRTAHLHIMYPNVSADEMRVISQAIYLLNPVVYIL